MALGRRGILLVVAMLLVVAAIVFAVYDRSGERRSGSRFVFELDADTTVTKQTGLDAWLHSIRERLGQKAVETTVVVRDGTIVVEIIDLDKDAIPLLEELLVRRATLAFVPVDVASGFSQSLHDRVERDPPPGIQSDVEAWIDAKSRTEVRDPYLRAEDREELLSPADARAIGCTRRASGADILCRLKGSQLIGRYLQAIAGELPVPDDREIGYEHVWPAGKARSYWRTYLLERTAWLTGAAIARVHKTVDRDDRPSVVIELTTEGRQRFSGLTGANIGRKVAIVIDGRVHSAPVINAAIPTGQVVITMGAGDLAKQDLDAIALVEVLKVGSLPGQLRHVSTSEFEAASNDGIRWSVLALLGLVGVALAIFAMMRSPAGKR